MIQEVGCNMAELLAANQITIAKVLDGEKGEMSAEQLAQLNQASEDAANAQTDINTLSDKTRSGYIETLSGTGFVQSTKTEDGGTAEVVVYGKSNQKVTQQSANLCPTYDKWTLSGGAYIDGDYIVFPSNGATAVVDVHWKKASNIAYFYINCKRDGDDAATLLISSSNGNDRAKVLQTDETTYNGIFGGNNVYGDTLLAMEYVRLTLKHYQTTTGSMRIKNFMVSSTNTPYVPFVPDSPSPEYPSEIQSVENPIVTACGKNLIDRSKNTMNSYIAQDTGIMISSATAASYNAEATDFIPVEVGEPYYYSGYISENIGNTGAMYDDNKNFVAPIISDSDIAPLVVPNGVSYIRLTIWGIYYENGDKSVAQLEKGSTPTDYEPYQGNIATLSDIVLRSIPNVTKDKLFKDTDGLWKVDRKCGVVDLGTLAWTYNSTYAVFAVNVNTYTSFPTSGPNNMGVCSKYLVHESVVASELVNYDDTIFICPDNWSSSKWLLVRDTSYTDATTFKSAMSGAMLVYELATPTYETLPDSIQSELNALTTYNPITNVMVSDGITPDIDVSFWTRDYYAKNAAENAAKVATNFITEIANGIYVHRDGDALNGVQITDDVDIVRGGASVIHLGDDENNDTIVRVGEANEANVEITPTRIKMGENFDVTQDGTVTMRRGVFGGFEIVPVDGGMDYLNSDWEASDGNFYRTWIRSAENTDLGQTWAFSAQMKNQNDGNLYGGFIIKSNGDTLIGPKDATGAESMTYFHVTKNKGIQIYPNKTVTKQPNLYWVPSGTKDLHRLCYTTWSASSEQIKDEIKSIENAELNPQNLYDVNVVQFKYKPDVLGWDDERYGKELIGFIIEDLNEKYPIAVDKADEYDPKTWNWNSAYMIPAMLKLIQEQHKEIEELKELMKGNK